MKFRNPFVGAMMRAAHTVTRKTAIVMQKRAINAAVAVIHQTFKHGLPNGGLASPSQSPSEDINPQSEVLHAVDAPDRLRAGQFVARSLTNAAGTRAYKLYIPASYTGQPMPLLVMLHGCKQDPDDFATGTRMNEIAEKAGCFVVYPAQTKSANGYRCWNWFSAIDQQRNRGEASIIADITRTVIEAYGCDRRRIFVAGLSAGGAMAVIMGNRYPELYAAVGVHSGLPYGAARDLPSASAAMRRGADDMDARGHTDYADYADHHGKTLPIIVFHGDLDKTVHPRNGEQIIEQALAHIVNTARKEQGDADGVSDEGSSPSYTREIYEDDTQRPMAELWTLHGVAHAWSGGSAGGSYTVTDGPDASKEMMRFFTTAAWQ
ncbi:MAG: esterase, depolymerase family protein [Herbaspirillum sp.]|nr:esterase, depolymerase family protein [Herbaspirillum sp.]